MTMATEKDFDLPLPTTPQKGTTTTATTTEESEDNNKKDMEKNSPSTTKSNEASTGENNNNNDENYSTPEKKQHPKEHDDDEEENNEKKKSHQQGSPTSVISSNNNDIDININTSSLTQDDANSVVSTASSRTNDDRIRTRMERRRLRRTFQEKKEKKKKQQKQVRVSVYSVSSPESNYLENTKSAASGNPTIQSVMMMNDLNLNNGKEKSSTNNLKNTNTTNNTNMMSSDSISNNTVTQSINSSITDACMPAGIVSVAEAGCKRTGLLDNENNCVGGVGSRKSHCDALMNDSTCSFPNTTSLNDSACTDITDDPSVLFSQAVDFLLPEEEKSKRKSINNNKKKSPNRGKSASSPQEHGGELGIEIMPGDGGTISVEEVSNIIIYSDDSNSNSSKENNTPGTALVSSQDNENTTATNTIEDHMSPMARMRYIREKKETSSKDPPTIHKSFSGTGSTSSSTVITKNTTNKKSSPRKNKKKKKNSANTSFDSWFKGDWVGGNGVGAEGCNDVNSGADALVNQTLKIPEMLKNILSNNNDGTCGGMAIQDGMNMNLSFFHDDDEEELSSSGSEDEEEDEEEYYDDGQTLSGDETSHASTISEESSESDLSSNNTNKNKSRRNNREASDDDDESEDETNGELMRNRQAALDTNNATATSTTGGPSSSSDSAAAEGPLSQYYRKSSFDTPAMEPNDMNNKQSGSAKPANSTGMIDDIIASSEDSKNTATGGILKNGKKNNNNKDKQQQKKTQAQDNNSKKKAPPQVADPCDDPKFLEMFVEEVINVGLSLTWHKEQSTQFYEKPKTVIACIELGRCVSSNAHHHNTHTSTFAEPKFVWDAQDDIINLSESFENSRNNNNHDDESSKIHKIDLFDIISIEKAGIMNFHSYPFAIPGNSFFVTLSDGSSFLFEAKDSEEQHRIISGLHRLISRFTYNLIAGEIDVCWDLFACSGESLEMDNDISPESLTVEELDLWFISKAMNDVTHLLFEKSCNQVTEDEDEV